MFENILPPPLKKVPRTWVDDPAEENKINDPAVMTTKIWSNPEKKAKMNNSILGKI